MGKDLPFLSRRQILVGRNLKTECLTVQVGASNSQEVQRCLLSVEGSRVHVYIHRAARGGLKRQNELAKIVSRAE